MQLRLSILVLGLWLLLVPQLSLAVNIPAPPGEKPWLLDQADLLSFADRDRVMQLQERAWQEHGVAVFVVTFERKAHLGAAQLNYQQLARQWLRTWQPAFHGNNRPGGRDLILLVGEKDRYAWMQTGQSWSHQTWSPHVQQLMDAQILPLFSDERYGAGMIAAAEAMLDMAAAGPHGKPPNLYYQRGPGIEWNWLDSELWLSSPLPTIGQVVLAVAGFALAFLALGAKEKQHGMRWLLAGVYVVLLALLFWPVLALTVLWVLSRLFPNQRRRGWGGHQLLPGVGGFGGSSGNGGSGGSGGSGGGGGAGGGGGF